MRSSKLLKSMVFVSAILFLAFSATAQVTFPENGVADTRHGHYAFTNATIIKDANTRLTGATMVIKDGKITAVGNGIKIPAGAVEIDCKGKFLYPSFIDIYADYGVPVPQRTTGPGQFTVGQLPQLATATKTINVSLICSSEAKRNSCFFKGSSICWSHFPMFHIL